MMTTISSTKSPAIAEGQGSFEICVAVYLEDLTRIMFAWKIPCIFSEPGNCEDTLWSTISGV